MGPWVVLALGEFALGRYRTLALPQEGVLGPPDIFCILLESLRTLLNFKTPQDATKTACKADSATYTLAGRASQPLTQLPHILAQSYILLSVVLLVMLLAMSLVALLVMLLIMMLVGDGEFISAIDFECIMMDLSFKLYPNFKHADRFAG